MLKAKSRPVSLERTVADPVTTTATAVPILRDGAVVTTDVVALAPEVIRMTCGAIGREGRMGPVHRLGIVAMAGGTQQVGAMIQWLVAQPRVPEIVR